MRAEQSIRNPRAWLGAITRTFSSFNSHNYRLYFSGQLLSVIGTWISRTAQAWLVLKLTNSSFDLGLVTALQAVPMALFSLFGGVLADRFPKRRVLVITQSVMASSSLIMAILIATGNIRIWQVYLLAMLTGLATAFDNPTRQAFVSEMVGQENLANAVALNSSLFNAARIIGPAIGGALIAGFSLSVPFFVDTVSFLAVITGLILMRPSEFHNVPPPVRGAVLKRLGEGLDYARKTPQVLLVLIVLCFIGAFGYNFTVILPLIAEYVLHTGALGFGGLTTAMGVGSLAGALGMAYLSRPTERILLGGATLFTVVLAVLGVSTQMTLTIAILIVLGVCSISFSATANSRLQLGAPPELRGRVMSFYIFFMAGMAPVGSLLVGALAQDFGVRTAVWSMAGLCAVGVIAGYLFHLSHPTTRDIVEESLGAAED